MSTDLFSQTMTPPRCDELMRAARFRRAIREPAKAAWFSAILLQPPHQGIAFGERDGESRADPTSGEPPPLT